jgi:PPOX class probable F420-dependent enzyme
VGTLEGAAGGAPAIGVPHPQQKRTSGAFANPQCSQGRAADRLCPQSPQKRAASGFSEPQDGQFTNKSLGADRGFVYPISFAGTLGAPTGGLMDPEQAREFVRDHANAVLATRRRDGRPQMSPVSVGVDDEGLVIVSTREDAIKTRNVRRDPRVSLCVLKDEFYGGHVQVDGTASILSLPEAMEPLVDYYRRVARKEHPDWDDYRRAMERDRRCLMRIEIGSAGPDQAG